MQCHRREGQRNEPKSGEDSIYVQAGNATTRHLAVMNLALRGIGSDFGHIRKSYGIPPASEGGASAGRSSCCR